MPQNRAFSANPPVLSSDFQRNALSSESDEVLVWLLEINHRSLTEPIRISSDKTELLDYDEESGTPIYCTKHNGHDYIEGSFGFVPPGNPEDGQIPQARFVVASDQRIIQAVRNIHDGLTLNAKLVHASDPDTVIAEIPELLLTSVTYDAGQVEAALGLNHFMDEPCGWVKCLPSVMPGLFKNGVAVL